MALRKELILACTLIVALSSLAVAQPPEGRGRRGGFGREMPGLALLGQKSIQDELKLSEQQIADATKAMESQRTSLQGIFTAAEGEREEMVKKAQAESLETLAKILSADQLKRFNQIRLQTRGIGALTDEETAKTLGLSDDQKQQIAKIDEEVSDERRGLFQNRDGDREAARKKMIELSKAALEKAQAVLTAEQKAKWTELTGPAFTGEITFGGGRGGFGGGRGPGGRGERGDRPARPATE